MVAGDLAFCGDNADKMCVLEMAREIDRQSSGRGNASFSFFLRASAEICNAINADPDPKRQATLVQFFSCIDNHRLRTALEAATECHSVPAAAPVSENGRTS